MKWFSALCCRFPNFSNFHGKIVLEKNFFFHNFDGISYFNYFSSILLHTQCFQNRIWSTKKNAKKFIFEQLAKIKTCRLLRKNFSYINGAIKINSFKQPISMTLVTILISNAESHSDWCYCSHSVCMFGFSVCFALFPSLCAPRFVCCTQLVYVWNTQFFFDSFLRARSHVPLYALYNVLPCFICESERVFEWAERWVCDRASNS